MLLTNFHGTNDSSTTNGLAVSTKLTSGNTPPLRFSRVPFNTRLFRNATRHSTTSQMLYARFQLQKSLLINFMLTTLSHNAGIILCLLMGQSSDAVVSHRKVPRPRVRCVIVGVVFVS